MKNGLSPKPVRDLFTTQQSVYILRQSDFALPGFAAMTSGKAALDSLVLMITAGLSHKIEFPACRVADVGYMIFQYPQHIQRLRYPSLPLSFFHFHTPPLRVCNIRVVSRRLRPSLNNFRSQVD